MEAVGRDHFGALLKQFRLDAGMTQQDLAERARLSVEAISTLERGARTRPHNDTVMALARALDLPPQREVELRSAVDSSRGPQRDVRSLLRLIRSEVGAASHSNLPQALTSFVGRESELSDIAALLRQHRVVTIVGAGGVGKTRAAIEMARNAIDGFPDGAWLVDLAPLAHEGLVDAAVLGAIRLTSPPGPALEAAIAYLRTRQLLLIFDNCEHVISRARAVVASIVKACPAVHVLATSRQALGLAGEQVYRLPSLSVPPDACRTAHSALSHAGVALFLDRAREAQPTFALSDDNAFDVAEISRRLDGIPLAIELAAARTNVLSPRQIAELLDRRFRLLTTPDSRVLPRHQTMTALIAWSYDLLTPREQRFFRTFSIFAGGCTLEAAVAVCGVDEEDGVDVVNLITSLVTKSLLVAESVGSEHRYRLLESSRQYAWEKLVASGAQGEITRRHARFYVGLAERLEGIWGTMADAEWLALVSADLENWRAVFEWTLAKRNDVALGQRLAASGHLVGGCLPQVETRSWMRIAFESVDTTTPRGLLARLEQMNADHARQRGEFTESLAAAERALVLYSELDDKRGSAWARSLAGGAMALLERAIEAEPLLQDALETAHALGDRRLAATVLMQMGWVKSAVGDFGGARGYGIEAQRLAKTLGAEPLWASITGDLANYEILAGDTAEALQLNASLLASLRPITSSWGGRAIAVNLSERAMFLIKLGRYDEAKAHANEALELASELGLSVIVLVALHHLAEIALRGSQACQCAVATYAGIARLLGFLNYRRTALGISKHYGVPVEYDDSIEILRDVIEAEELGRLLALGSTMTEEEAIEQARAFS